MLIIPRRVELGGDGQEVEKDRIQVILKDVSLAGLEWDLSRDQQSSGMSSDFRASWEWIRTLAWPFSQN